MSSIAKSSTDRIEKRVVLRAPRTRVWNAISEPEHFGKWFRVAWETTPFVEGQPARGRLLYPGYEDHILDIQIEKIEPERYFAFRWHPHAVDPNKEYGHEPTTLVEFRLEETEGGTVTVLTIVESGFDRIPLSRRAEAFRANEGGWAEQIQNIERYVASQF
jgi:uncharacterized protein YndB with AHSA1/START domain